MSESIADLLNATLEEWANSLASLEPLQHQIRIIEALGIHAKPLAQDRKYEMIVILRRVKVLMTEFEVLAAATIEEDRTHCKETNH